MNGRVLRCELKIKSNSVLTLDQCLRMRRVFPTSTELRYSLNPAHHFLRNHRFAITLGGSRGYSNPSGRQGPQFWGKH
jgi:hypothetical protein